MNDCRSGRARAPYRPSAEEATIRTILFYGAFLAAGALGLQWLEYRFLIQRHSTEIYVALIAATFLGLRIWVGARLFRKTTPREIPNTRACRALGISDRELEVLELLATGRSNKEILIVNAARCSSHSS